ncbi:hypothetical protein CLOM_g14300 [Closterium sp. NIES-68]|nr:hypothetical protein CLOM_g14300 [Closterium sp. NIES-68]GJP61719.1 hypothetical protein CLOP_g18860 [Closterium sp. NIES-67]
MASPAAALGGSRVAIGLPRGAPLRPQLAPLVPANSNTCFVSVETGPTLPQSNRHRCRHFRHARVSASLFGSSSPSPPPSASPSAASASASTADLANAAEAPGKTVWLQKTIELPPYKRGCHVITSQIMRAVPEIAEFRVGIANLFVLHTSASLTINENASPDVPLDMEDALNRIAPEGNHYRHLDEGYDDMPAHVKSSLMGCSLTIPIMAGRFKLGIWQGIYLNEHRNYGGARQVCITIHGEKRADGR